MDFEIDSYTTVGPVRFGMSADEVRRLLPGPFKTFMKAFSAYPTDAFPIGLHVHYRPPGTVTAVELFSPAVAVLEGETLVARPFREAFESLRKLDAGVVANESGCTSAARGVGLYAPGAADNPGALVEGVIAFERGYYEHEEWSVDAARFAEFTAKLRRKS